ncbi:MAG TPA: BPSS1780 family membrane protein [Gammaproteobacteria bacterium]
MSADPYAPPRNRVADPDATLPDGAFVPGGRGVSAGRGWDWIADAWRLMGPQRWTFIGVLVLYWLMFLAASYVPVLGGFVAALFAPVLLGGVMLGCDAVRRGEQLEVRHLFLGFQRHFGKLVGVGAISLGLSILVVIVMGAIIGASFGTMMLAGAEPSPEDIVGMGTTILLAALVAMAISIPAYMFLWFASPLIVLGGLDVGAALKASFSGCLKNVLPYLVWGVIVLVLAIAATIPLFLGWLLLAPVLTVSVYTAYRDIFYKA